MITTLELKQAVQSYRERCRIENTPPTFKGMGDWLGVSGVTISNVVHETFNGRRYTEHPHKTRIIDNNDFQILQRLFDSREDLSV